MRRVSSIEVHAVDHDRQHWPVDVGDRAFGWKCALEADEMTADEIAEIVAAECVGDDEFPVDEVWVRVVHYSGPATESVAVVPLATPSEQEGRT